MRITKDTVVELQYSITNQDGDVIDPGKVPMSYLHGGYFGIFPKVEAALEGKTVGDDIQVVLQPADHYGERNDDLIDQVERSMLPPEVEVNMLLEARNEETGEQHLVTVIDLTDDTATLDANHPFSGMVLVFSATVLNVRAATAEEVEHKHAHNAGSAHH